MNPVRALAGAPLLALLASGILGCAQQPTQQVGFAAPDPDLAPRVAQLESRIKRLLDINDIKRLQRAYGYYHDEGQWNDVADLFAEDASIEIGKDGVYRGRDRIRQYFMTLGNGHNGLAPGQLSEHLQEMPVITLAADGSRANATWRAVILEGQLGKEAWWSEGPYENEYVKQNGVWKISKLHWFQTLRVPYEGGWAKNPDTNGARFVGDRLKADAPPTVQYKTWPGAFTPPFHFRGQYPGLLPINNAAATIPASGAQLASRIAALTPQAQRLADQDDVENLQRIYAFYLDKGLWSEAAVLFTDDAELEVQGRGIFRGRDRILAYLHAVGPEGLTSGRLYDHMLLQPITHIDPQGQAAKGRWHVFAQLAQAGKFHEWETGIYENEYRKDAGTWKIRRLHFYPTMITPYEQGWGKVSLASSRFEPSLKPDAPSRGPASTYDSAFVTPFHYPHPVRGAGPQ
ncbi:MAG: nuclear transport factor 2 family protein, partial [Pseudomonadota bacterium]